MAHRIARVLLALALASSGVSAPFLHVHAHGSAHAASHGAGTDEHCEHHHAEGVHWHPTGSAAPDSGGSLATAGGGHLHAAVALSAAAIESSSTDVGRSITPIEAPEAGAPPMEHGARAPVDPTAGPDPPPLARAAARAPPIRC